MTELYDFETARNYVTAPPYFSTLKGGAPGTLNNVNPVRLQICRLMSEVNYFPRRILHSMVDNGPIDDVLRM